MKVNTLSTFAIMTLAVWAAEGPADTTEAKPANKVPTKKTHKRGCFSACMGACSGEGGHKGVGTLAEAAVDLSVAASNVNQDGKNDEKEAVDVAHGVEGVIGVLGEMADNFQHLKDQDIPDGTTPPPLEATGTVEKTKKSKRKHSDNKSGSGIDSNTTSAAKHKKKSSGEKKSRSKPTNEEEKK